MVKSSVSDDFKAGTCKFINQQSVMKLKIRGNLAAKEEIFA